MYIVQLLGPVHSKNITQLVKEFVANLQNYKPQVAGLAKKITIKQTQTEEPSLNPLLLEKKKKVILLAAVFQKHFVPFKNKQYNTYFSSFFF